MNYGLTTNPFDSNDCVVLGFFSDALFDTIPPVYETLLTRLRSKLHEEGDHVWQSDLDGQKSVLLIHCGAPLAFTPERLTKRIREIMETLVKQHIHTATIALPQLSHHAPDWQLQHMLLQIEHERFQLTDFKTQKKKPFVLESISFYLPYTDTSTIQSAQAIAAGIHLTRTLGELPANICTPTYLAEQALLLAAQHPQITTKVLEREAMQALGMGSFLSVAQGSQQAPKLIELHYTGKNKKDAPIVLVGKGVTFDSGGISLKPSAGMEEMKYDMCGAASVLGTIKACALLQLPINVVGLLAATENMPSGSATKPGDIVTSLSGQTIEIINTDAEGRLILADTLTYAEQFKPTFVLDIATLTGAVVVALGHVITGFMTPDDALAELIEQASIESNDKAWRLPLDDAFQESIESPLADIMNSTYDKTAGSITAACFLSRFTKSLRWAHLDIAGTAWTSGRTRKATGRPVKLLIQLLRHVANSH